MEEREERERERASTSPAGRPVHVKGGGVHISDGWTWRDFTSRHGVINSLANGDSLTDTKGSC